MNGNNKPLSEVGDSSSIWNAVHHSKTHKLLEGAPVIDLEFQLFIAEVEKLLENEHLEKDQRVNPLAPCIAPALVLIALVKQWSE
jgi:hypothetical protein